MKDWLLGATLMVFSLSASANEECKLLKLASLPIDYADLRPTLHGTFNGVDLRLLMDSGADNTVLFSGGVEKAGLTRAASNIISVGVGGTATSFIAVAKEAEIGPSRGKDVRFLAVENTTVATDGLLGADYLFRTDVEIFLKENKVTFLQAEHCDDKSISYWDREAPWIESYNVGGADQRQRIDVKVNGQLFTALLDTGATRSVINLRAATRIGLTPDSSGTQPAGQAVGVGSRSVTLWRAHIDTFEIGEEMVRNSTVRIADISGAAVTRRSERFMPDMILGTDFMQAHRLLFSPSQHRLYFSYVGGQIFSPEAPPQ